MLKVLIGAACAVVIVAGGLLIYREIDRNRQAAEVDAAVDAVADAQRCADWERQLTLIKAGTPTPGAASENVVRLEVYFCRGSPEGRIPADM